MGGVHSKDNFELLRFRRSGREVPSGPGPTVINDEHPLEIEDLYKGCFDWLYEPDDGKEDISIGEMDAASNDSTMSESPLPLLGISLHAKDVTNRTVKDGFVSRGDGSGVRDLLSEAYPEEFPRCVRRRRFGRFGHYEANFELCHDRLHAAHDAVLNGEPVTEQNSECDPDAESLDVEGRRDFASEPGGSAAGPRDVETPRPEQYADCRAVRYGDRRREARDPA